MRNLLVLYLILFISNPVLGTEPKLKDEAKHCRLEGENEARICFVKEDAAAMFRSWRDFPVLQEMNLTLERRITDLSLIEETLIKLRDTQQKMIDGLKDQVVAVRKENISLKAEQDSKTTNYFLFSIGGFCIGVGVTVLLYSLITGG